MGFISTGLFIRSIAIVIAIEIFQTRSRSHLVGRTVRQHRARYLFRLRRVSRMDKIEDAGLVS